MSFEATGSASPNPLAEMRSGLTPCETRNAITLSARFCDRISFEVTPCRSSARPIGALSISMPSYRLVADLYEPYGELVRKATGQLGMLL